MINVGLNEKSAKTGRIVKIVFAVVGAGVVIVALLLILQDDDERRGVRG